MPKLIVVNKKDEKIGVEDKLKCHLGKGILHRAFTVFIFNDKDQVLIQKRSKGKLLWPLFWETSCSSHPYEGEDLIKSAEKRLREELGFTCKLKFLDKFYYHSLYKNIGAENEICWLLVGRYNGKVVPDLKEVADWKWINLEDLKQDIKKNPAKYVPWLKIAIKRLNRRRDPTRPMVSYAY